MIVYFYCPCGKPMGAESQYMGLWVKCPECGARVQVMPAPPDAPPAESYRPSIYRPVATQGNGLAVASLVMSLVGFACMGIVLGPLAVIFGIIAVKQAVKDPNVSGRNMAIAGIILGSLATLVHLGFFSFTIARAFNLFP